MNMIIHEPEWLMPQALALAANGLTLTAPNPRVGCVLASAQGEVLGQGHTQQAGGPHAEIMALRDATANGHSVIGATAYVTLEPCSHHGRTGPCCDALIAAGIKKVVASIADSRMIRKTPWVRMKVAASLDGATALTNGRSQWITSPEARADGHAWRARAGAVLTGIGTLLQDDPRLDVRLVETPRQPFRVIVDSRLQTPPGANIFKAGGPVWIYTATPDADTRAALLARGATVSCLPDAHGKVDLAAMMKDLAQREINELHVEAGSKLNGSLIRAGLVDEFLVYLAPKLLGPGQGMASFGPLHALSDAIELQFQATEMVGVDLRVIARVAGRDKF